MSDQKLAEALHDMNWLLEGGFTFVLKKLMHGAEFLRPVGAVQTTAWADGAHNALLAGHVEAKQGLIVEAPELYCIDAETQLTAAS
jgi:hypothetical protein